MKTSKVIIALFVGLLLAACNDTTPEPLWHSVSQYYQPAANDTSYVAQLRRAFHQETGAYLLLSDTIRHDSIGVDAYGRTVYDTERLDLNYNIGTSSLSHDTQTYTLLTDTAEIRQAVDFVREFVAPHFTGLARPYMYLVARTISTKRVAGGTTSNYAVSGQRGLAVACDYLLQRERTESQKQNLANRMISIMLSRVTSDNIERFADFAAISNGYYDVTWSNYGTDRNSVLRGMGFIAPSSSSSSSTPSLEYDLSLYADAVQNQDSAQFAATYGAWPKCMQKYNIMRSRLPELGYVK